MLISKITSPTFQRKLLASEEAEFSSVLKEGKKKLGNTGHSILILPSSSLPQEFNTGVGNLLDKEGMRFIDFAQKYWGINCIQLLPEGNFVPKAGSFFPYSGSSIDLGPQLINTELLTTPEYGNLLDKSDLEKIVNANKNINKNSRINYENLYNKNSANNIALRQAFENLLKADSTEKQNIIKDFEQYAESNKEWLEPTSIYEAFATKNGTRDTRKWSNFEHNFYNTDIVATKDRLKAISDLKASKEFSKEMKFYEFKQFLAEKHLSKAKQELNKKGIKLSGDVLIGFSFNEVWANPKAFLKDKSIGWGLYGLNFDSPDFEKVLRTKVRNFAKRYDCLRFDAAWTYIKQPIIDNVTKEVTYKENSSKILDIIEDEIIKIKSKDFNYSNLMYEFAADPNVFDINNEIKLNPNYKDKIKIYTSSNLSSDWGSTSAFKNKGWGNGSFVIGVSNHDSLPLKMEFNNLDKRKIQIEALSEILDIPKEELNTYKGFSQAKFAEPMRSKHSMFFFADALNIDKIYKNIAQNSIEDYRIKIPLNYQDDYFNAIQKGEGFNIMDALDKAFVAEGLDKKEAKLYKKIVKYKKILQDSEKNYKTNIYLKIAIGVGLGIGLIVLLVNKKAGKTGSNKKHNNQPTSK